MQDKIIKKIESYNNIAILGFGREGNSTYNFIRKHNKTIHLTILDEKEIELDDEYASYKKYNGEESLKEYDLIIKTPGIAIPTFSKETRDRITSQMELLLEVNRKNMVGITGTKGKSTTSSLIYTILKDQLNDVYLVGNIGVPVLDLIDDYKENTIVVAEMSSHQLETVKQSPHIGIILNLYQDHLDHTSGIKEYNQAKMNIIKYQDKEDYAIVNNDNEYLQKQDFSKIISNILKVSTEEKSSIYLQDNNIYINDKLLLKKDELKTNLQGEHNLKNIMFALLVANIYNLDLNKTLDSISKLKPLEHIM